MKRNNIAAILVAAAGLALSIAGLLTGGYMSVFRKAAAICLECIGLG